MLSRISKTRSSKTRASLRARTDFSQRHSAQDSLFGGLSIQASVLLTRVCVADSRNRPAADRHRDGHARGWRRTRLFSRRSSWLPKKNGEPETALVDGHQRVMSLTILFAVLRATSKAILAGRSCWAASFAAPRSGLPLRTRWRSTCEHFVQAPGATLPDPDEDLAAFPKPNAMLSTTATTCGPNFRPPTLRPRSGARLSATSPINAASSSRRSRMSREGLELPQNRRGDAGRFQQGGPGEVPLVRHRTGPEERRTECQSIWSALRGDDRPRRYARAASGTCSTLKKRKQSGKPVESDIAESYGFNKPGACLSFLRNDLQPAARAPARNCARGRMRPLRPYTERLSWIDPQLWVPARAAVAAASARCSADGAVLQAPRPARVDDEIAGYDPTKQYNRIINLLGEIDRDGRTSRRCANST